MTLELLATTDSRKFSMEEQLHLLESITGETNPPALRNLKERYNQVVDRQLEQHRGPLLDPVEQLPPEIWLQIFRDVGSGGQGDYEFNPIDYLLLASLVSPKWRDAILYTPEIWTEVTVDPPSTSMEDELFKLHAAMYFSGEGLLTLRLRPPCYKQWEGDNGFHRVISNHARRIQKIVFVGAWYRNLPAYAINKLLLSLGPLPQLRVVHMTKKFLWTNLSWGEFLSNAPALRSLVIKYYPSAAFPDQRRIASGCRYIADFVKILHLCTPTVKEFYFHSGLVDYLPFRYVSFRRHLFNLTLSLPELNTIREDMLIQSKSLICLNLKINTILISSFFRGLACPNLHRTVFLADKKYDRSLPSPIVTFGPAALSRLESIEWRNCPVFWQITSLQALRKLILAEWNREMISELCLHFIMRPHDCPSLAYIEFGAIPEWDLLFMMLERRNHSTRFAVSRITTLVFPVGISYSLLAPMTELLNGQFAIRLSYHDVSISSIAEFYFDTSLTGCNSCLFSMNSCTREVMIRKGGFVRTRGTPRYPTPPAANPPLSAEMSSWLDGREERDRIWDAKDTEWRQQHISRSASCSSPTSSRRIIVTEFTLKGVHFCTMVPS